MAETTKNYGLVTPSVDEFYDVGVHNGNMERLDRALQGLETKKADLDSPVFTGRVKVPQPSEVPADDEAATVKFVKENGQGVASSVEISEEARAATGAAEDNVDAALVSVGNSMAGKKVEGLTLKTAVDTETGAAIEEVAKTGAEIFNDYREREFTPAGFASLGNVATGKYSHAQGSGTTAIGDCSHAEGSRTEASGKYSHAEGYRTKANAAQTHTEGINTEANANGAHAEGYNTVASGQDSHAEGAMTAASGLASHAEGQQNTSSGNSSHAEGFHTTASGERSHAEGIETIASGESSHAEGIQTIASGTASHSEGNATETTGDYSHVEGVGTIAISTSQHVEGRFNVEDNLGIYAHIVGNGVGEDLRSNAHTLDWDGNAWFAGDVTIGAEKKTLVTEESLQAAFPSPTESGTILYSTGEGVRRNIPFLIGEPKGITGLAVEKVFSQWVTLDGNDVDDFSFGTDGKGNAGIRTEQQVDLTSTSSIRVEYNASGLGGGLLTSKDIQLHVGTSTNILQTAKYVTSDANGSEVMELDVTNLSGNYYIFVFIHADTNATGVSSATITSVQKDAKDILQKCLTLTWTNPTDLLIPQTVHIRRSSEAYPATLEEGVEVYSGSDESCLDETADLSTDQYYTAWVDNSMVTKTDESMKVKYSHGVDYLMLYDHGDECVDVTGGWRLSSGSTGTARKDSDSLFVNGTGSGYLSLFTTTSTVDVTEYDEISALVQCSKIAGVGLNHYSLRIDTTDIANPSFSIRYSDKNRYQFCIQGNQTNKLWISSDIKADPTAYINVWSDNNNNREGSCYAIALLRTDDYTSWLRAGNLNPSDYPTLDSLLADETAMGVLMNSSAAVDRMIQYTGTVMAGVTNSTVAMTTLDRSSYALSKAMKNADWYKFMMMSPVAQEILDASAIKVPTMTSNTAPSGEAFGTTLNVNGPFWKMFDKNNSIAGFGTTTGSNDVRLGYKFNQPVCCYKIRFAPRNINEIGRQNLKNFKVQASEDGVNWISLTGTLTANQAPKDTFEWQSFNVEIDPSAQMYQYWCVFALNTYDDVGVGMSFYELEFYGKELIAV